MTPAAEACWAARAPHRGAPCSDRRWLSGKRKEGSLRCHCSGEEAPELRAQGAKTQVTPRLGDPRMKSSFRTPSHANSQAAPCCCPPHLRRWPPPQAVWSKRRVWGITYSDVSVEVPKGQPVTSLSLHKGALIRHHTLVCANVGRAASLRVRRGREALSVASGSSAAPQGGAPAHGARRRPPRVGVPPALCRESASVLWSPCPAKAPALNATDRAWLGVA